ncbi:MAG TPA: hypothetical protein VNE17_08105, partial [Nitrolancea sp.]|nr:hypothetical protein [Nitrolancea sp.]
MFTGVSRVLHTADLYLGRTFASWGAQIAEAHSADLRRTLDHIGQLSIERGAQLVLISGDLFELHNPSGLMREGTSPNRHSSEKMVGSHASVFVRGVCDAVYGTRRYPNHHSAP